MQRSRILQRMGAAVVITIGVAIVWGMVSAWSLSIIESWLLTPNQVYEALEVTKDGTAVISSRSTDYYDDITYRTLQGEPIEVHSHDNLEATRLGVPVKLPGLFSAGISWGQSLGVSDYGRPATAWFLIRTSDRYGRAYFVGYDVGSRMPVGYISRGGFRRSLPPRDDWFDVGLNHLWYGWGGVVTSTGYLAYNAPVVAWATDEASHDIPRWMVYLIDGERLVEIDLRNRTVRLVLKSPGMVSLGMVTQAESPVEQWKPLPDDDKTTTRLVLRSYDRIVVVDPQGDQRREFALPESLRDQTLLAYSLPNAQFLLHPSMMYDRETPFVWLDSEKGVVRKEKRTLANRVDPFGPRLRAAMGVIVLPVPATWSLTAVMAPLDVVAAGDAPDYTSGLASHLAEAWIGLLLVITVGTASAWCVWRWQTIYHRPATRAWCTFVVLFGLPALITYWLEHRAARLEACTDCGQTVPRDRDACAACDAPFPAPALIGTELIA